MGPGEIHIVQWNNLDAEVRGIAAFVNHLITVRGLNPAEILVLCPRRVIGYQIREQLSALEVPAHSFYHEESLEAEQAQLAFTLLRLFANAEDRVALRFWLGYGSPSWNRGEYARVRGVLFNLWPITSRDSSRGPKRRSENPKHKQTLKTL